MILLSKNNTQLLVKENELHNMQKWMTCVVLCKEEGLVHVKIG